MISIKMTPDKICKGSIRFATADEDAPITNVYVSKSAPGVTSAKEITVHLQVGGATVAAEPEPQIADRMQQNRQIPAEDAALLAALK